MPPTEDRPATPPATDFRRLPEPIALEDMVAEKDVRDAPDPDFGRDPNTEWMLKHA